MSTRHRTTRDASRTADPAASRLRPGAHVRWRDLAGTAASFGLILALLLGLAPGAAHGPGGESPPSPMLAALAR